MATDVNNPPATDQAGATPKKSNRGVILFLIGILASAAFTYYWFKVDTYHYIEVTPGVMYRDGNQDMRRFTTALDRSRPKTIVPLIDDAELADPKKKQFEQEMTVAPRYGAKVERVAIKLGGWPTTEDVRKFLDIAENKDNQPVLVHCAQGVRRTGMMVAAYQMSVLGYDKQKALASIEAFGHSERTTGDIKKFIEIYDPATRTVTQTMAQSNE